MIYVGVKASHDATVAAIGEDGNLLFSIEMEKLNNNKRYSKLTSLDDVYKILEQNNIRNYCLAFDGWKDGRMTLGGETLDVAFYNEFDDGSHVFGEKQLKHEGWSSFNHIAGHIAGSFAASPFTQEGAYVCVMDGGAFPRLYYINNNWKVTFRGVPHRLNGVIYSIISYYWGPFKDERIYNAAINPEVIKPPGFDHVLGAYEYPGKLMAYAGLGNLDEDFLEYLQMAYVKVPRKSLAFKMEFNAEHEFCRYAKAYTNRYNVSDEDAIRTVNEFLGSLLLGGLSDLIYNNRNLIFTGGSALNIKWNTKLRNSKTFKSVWVPPFCNDTGSAIGQAVLLRKAKTDQTNLQWDVYSGPQIISNGHESNKWEQSLAYPEDIAEMLELLPDEPIIVLNGKAEIGPRALGARSIIASAMNASMLIRLNTIKGREWFRPVSPICLEEQAKHIFNPGTPDPYMLFDHMMRKEWTGIIPAVMHKDQSARLQTVRYNNNFGENHPQNKIYDVLQRYYELTNIPVLCNTSANLNGCGFFPDVLSAMSWAENVGLNLIWSENNLFKRVK